MSVRGKKHPTKQQVEVTRVDGYMQRYTMNTGPGVDGIAVPPHTPIPTNATAITSPETTPALSPIAAAAAQYEAKKAEFAARTLARAAEEERNAAREEGRNLHYEAELSVWKKATTKRHTEISDLIREDVKTYLTDRGWNRTDVGNETFLSHTDTYVTFQEDGTVRVDTGNGAHSQWHATVVDFVDDAQATNPEHLFTPAHEREPYPTGSPSHADDRDPFFALAYTTVDRTSGAKPQLSFYQNVSGI